MTEPPDRAAAPAPTRLAARSPIEAFLWIFVTRLIALLTATGPRPSATTSADPTDDVRAGARSGTDPDRAQRVAASRAVAGAPAADRSADPAGTGPGPMSSTSPPDRTRAVAATTAAALVAGAAAFAVGRRRGAR